MKPRLFRLCIIIFLGICLIHFNGHGQGNFPPVYEITTDTLVADTIPFQYWKMLPDKGGALTIDQVRSLPVAKDFYFCSETTNNFNQLIRTYWLCFRLQNSMNHNAELTFGDTDNDYSTYYFNRNNKWEVHESGNYYPWKRLNGLNLNNYARITLKPNENILVYNRIHEFISVLGSQNKIIVQFYYANPKILSEYIQDESLFGFGIHDSILFGILLLACLFNLFIFFTVKERVYLYFALYVLLIGIGRMSGVAYFVFLREHRVFWHWIYFLIVWNFTTFLRTIFIQSFLRIRDHAPQWNRLLTWFNFITLAICCLSLLFSYMVYTMHVPIALFPSTIIALLYLLPNIILTFLVLISFLILWKDKTPEKLIKSLVFPLLCIWWIGYSITILYKAFGFILFSKEFTIWVNNSWYLIETICLGLLVLTFSWLLLWRFRQLQGKVARDALEREKEKNQLIEQKRVELEKTVEERTAELKLSLDHLRSTQAQLIQQEKMASLGELTGGIAHEIQNPLNFVNNFSEVNDELLSEVNEQIKQGNFGEVQKIVNNISDNEKKIIHHGKRADSIVKNMLQHSRTSTGQKEFTDINALADEYLRLSYHGFRAKDKSFNVAIKTDFDKAIGQINIIPQDIGRVFLNLFNNAFYAVTEKKKKSGDGYEPVVSVISKKTDGKVEIRVKDNGGGIPQTVLDKIFQPFFTTKPAGEGTGLGLSLAYDIVKAHGGEIKVETKDGDGSSFIVQLKI